MKGLVKLFWIHQRNNGSSPSLSTNYHKTIASKLSLNISIIMYVLKYHLIVIL